MFPVVTLTLAVVDSFLLLILTGSGLDSLYYVPSQGANMVQTMSNNLQASKYVFYVNNNVGIFAELKLEKTIMIMN